MARRRTSRFWRGPGPFEVSATVQTAVTKESLVELMKELTDIAGRRPVTDAELTFAKQGIIQGFPGRFETTFGVAGQIGILVTDDLPDDEFIHYQERVEAVSEGRCQSRRTRVRHAGENVDPDRGRSVADRGAAQEFAVHPGDSATRYRGKCPGPSASRQKVGRAPGPAAGDCKLACVTN